MRSGCANSVVTGTAYPIGMTEHTASTAIRLPRETLDHLRAEAKRRGLKADILAANILAAVVEGRIFAAVLDD